MSHGYGSHGAASSRQDLRDRFDIQLFGEIDDPDVVMNDTSQAFDHFEDSILRAATVRLAIVSNQLKDTGGWIEDIGDIGDSSRITCNGGVSNFKDLSVRIKGNLNAASFIVLRQHFITQNRGHERGNALRNIHITQSYNGQLMAAIWCPLEPFSKTADFYRDLFEVQTPLSYGTKEKPYPRFAFAGRELLFRAGYFWLAPRIWNDEDVLAATTFILPGMNNTPEYAYFRAMEKPDTITLEKSRTWIANQTVAQVEKSGDFSFLKRVHECIPQVSFDMDDLQG